MKSLLPLCLLVLLTACQRSDTTAASKDTGGVTTAAAQPPAEAKTSATVSTGGAGASQTTPTAVVASAQDAAASALVAKAKGRWIRPDGGYLLTIGSVGADGRADVGYFNPNPVNVAWGTVKSEGGQVKIQVELRDRNYPGCLYKLTYVPEKEQLAGTYFQAQMQETYDIVFVRE